MNSIVDIEALILAYIDAYNLRDVPAMIALLDDEVIFENVSNSSEIIKTTSKQEFEQLASQSVNFFVERKQIVRFSVFGVSSAAIEIDYQGIMAQDLPNGLKAGERLQLRGASFFEIVNGKFTRISDYS